MSDLVVNGRSLHADRRSPTHDVQVCTALVAALAVVMSATGACDTDNLPLAHRLLLWSVISALVVVQATLLARVAKRALTSAGRHAGTALAAVTTVVLTTIELHWLKYTPLLPKEPDPPLEFLLFITPMAGPIALLTLFVAHVRTAHQPALPVTSAKTDDQLVAADSAADRADWPEGTVLWVTAQDHYLSVRTVSGETLVRGRMKDAVRRLATEDGRQIHRSHWVAKDQMARVIRRGRDYRLVLRDATSLPIGRTRAAAVRALIR